MTETAHSLQNILERALDSEHGLGVLCHDSVGADKLKRKLYLIKKKIPTFESLVISMSPHSDQILYIHKKTELRPGGE